MPPIVESLSKTRFRVGSSINFPGGLLTLGFYYTTVLIGSPPVAFDVLLDTGSANLAVPVVQCDSTCGNVTQYYDPSKSSSATVVQFASNDCAVCNPNGSTQDCLFGKPYPALLDNRLCGYGISYGGGSSFVSGFLVQDLVSWGGYSVKNTIVGITSQIPVGGLSIPPVNGIIGLANENNAVNPTWAPTIFGQIAAATPSLGNQFSICLNATNGGILDLGAPVASRYQGELQWIPMVQNRWYNMPLQDVLVGGQTVGLPAFTYSYLNDQIGTFIDSGTTALLLGPAIFTAVQTVFQTQYCSLPGVCSSSNIFNGGCITDQQMGNSLGSFPTLTFTFQGEAGDVKLSTPPQSYFFHAGGQYCSALASVPGISAVLGDVFMQNFYIAHDRANSRVGFAAVATCA